MLEIPEAHVIAKQLDETLKGKIISRTIAAKSPHGFAWYYGEPAEYDALLEGKKITAAIAYGGRPEIHAEDMIFSFGDGVISVICRRRRNGRRSISSWWNLKMVTQLYVRFRCMAGCGCFRKAKIRIITIWLPRKSHHL